MHDDSVELPSNLRYLQPGDVRSRSTTIAIIGQMPKACHCRRSRWHHRSRTKETRFRKWLEVIGHDTQTTTHAYTHSDIHVFNIHTR